MKSQTRPALFTSLILPAAFIGGCALMDGTAADASAPRAERGYREHATGSNIPRREYDTSVRSISTEELENAQRGKTPALTGR